MLNFIRNQLQIAKLYANIIKQLTICMPKWWNWQTRRTQNPVMATSCGFKSRLRHQFLRVSHRDIKNRETIISLFFCHFSLDSLFAVKVRITEIVTLARDATRLLAIPSLRSLQVPPSAPLPTQVEPKV